MPQSKPYPWRKFIIIINTILLIMTMTLFFFNNKTNYPPHSYTHKMNPTPKW